MLPYNFPSVSKFSTFLVAVILPGGGKAFVDASSKHGGLNEVPEVMRVERARLVQKGRKGEWVNLQKIGEQKK